MSPPLALSPSPYPHRSTTRSRYTLTRELHKYVNEKQTCRLNQICELKPSLNEFYERLYGFSLQFWLIYEYTLIIIHSKEIINWNRSSLSSSETNITHLLRFQILKKPTNCFWIHLGPFKNSICICGWWRFWYHAYESLKRKLVWRKDDICRDEPLPSNPSSIWDVLESRLIDHYHLPIKITWSSSTETLLTTFVHLFWSNIPHHSPSTWFMLLLLALNSNPPLHPLVFIRKKVMVYSLRQWHCGEGEEKTERVLVGD